MNIVKCILIVVLVFMIFILGRRFESNEIRLQLESNGYAISRYGDHKQIKIIGTSQPYNNRFHSDAETAPRW